MLERIGLTELATPCLTRDRGAEAYENLLPRLQDRVELDLDADIISSSFLDELILRLDRDKLLDRVIFIVGESAHISKLEHISGTRETTILVQDDDYPPAAPVSPKPFRAGQATFVRSKQSTPTP